jgi:hypothetical protein
MSKLVDQKRREGKIRVYENGLLAGWDGKCAEDANKGKDHCSECTLRRKTMDTDEGEPGRTMLTWNRTVFAPNEYPAYEVILCHFQFGKKTGAMQRRSAPHSSALIAAEVVMYGYKEGFTVVRATVAGGKHQSRHQSQTLLRSTSSHRATRSGTKIAMIALAISPQAVKVPWLPLFLKSVALSGIDYILVGDPDPAMKIPGNVRVLPFSYSELVQRISTMLFDGAPLNMIHAPLHKLADTRPLLGYLFQRELADYDFWGHINTDMFVGDIRKFITPAMLREYDIIPGVGDRNGRDEIAPWGPFTLYRNKPHINQMFRQFADLRGIYNTTETMHIDERGGQTHTHFESSMAKVIRNQAKVNAIKIWKSGFAIGWDGLCRTDPSLRNAERCSECVLAQQTTHGSLHSSVTWNRSLFVDDGKWPTYEVMVCSFQFGNKHVLTQPIEQLLQAPKVSYGFNEGFAAVSILNWI